MKSLMNIVLSIIVGFSFFACSNCTFSFAASGITITEEGRTTDQSGDNWYYYADDNLLVLSGCSVGQIFIQGSDPIEIKLEDGTTNSINESGLISRGDMSISGEGSLNITGTSGITVGGDFHMSSGSVTETLSGPSNGSTVYGINADETIVIDGTATFTTSIAARMTGYGLYAYGMIKTKSKGDISISVGSNTVGSSTYGIYSCGSNQTSGDIFLMGSGQISVLGGTYAITNSENNSDGDIVINGASLVLRGKNAIVNQSLKRNSTLPDITISNNANVTVDGSNGTAQNYTTGIKSMNNGIQINDSSVDSSVYDSALFTRGDYGIKISGVSNVNASAKNGAPISSATIDLQESGQVYLHSLNKNALSGIQIILGDNNYITSSTDYSMTIGYLIAQVPSVTSGSPPNACVDEDYHFKFTATGTEPITWEVASGQLPYGISLDPETGVLSGAPIMTGTSQFGIKVTNGVGQTDGEIHEYTITVKKPKAENPNVEFVATGRNSGTLTTSTAGIVMYSIDAGDIWQELGANDSATIVGVTANKDILCYTKETSETSESDTITIDVTEFNTPQGLDAVACSNKNNNDGRITGVTDDLEYKRASDDEWFTCPDNEVTGLRPGTYQVRYKASGTTLASETAEVCVQEFADALTGTVIITGKPVPGKTLSANVTDSNNTGTLSYQWKRGDNIIENANASSYVVSNEDVGSILTCMVSSSVESGIISASTEVVSNVSIQLDKTDVTLSCGETVAIIANIVPSTMTDELNIEWRSSDESIAAVSEEGVVSAKKPGNATITASAEDIEATCSIVVKHNYSTEVVAPTCVKEGYTLHICSCGYSFRDAFIPALDHSFGEWIVHDSTCTSSGIKYRVCSECSLTETEEIDLKEHDWESDYTVDKEATCISDGSKSKHCKNCDATMDPQPIPSPGHDIVRRDGKTPTCTEGGYYAYETCSRCNYSTYQKIEALGHNWTHVKNSAGLLKNGSEYDQCTRCKIKQNVKTLVGYSTNYVKSFKAAKAKKAFTAKWKKQSKANQKKFNGYQIRYSINSNMSGAKTATAIKSSKSKKIKGLKAKTTYYVQVRTYTKSGGTTFYSSWSAKKSVKTK